MIRKALEEMKEELKEITLEIVGFAFLSVIIGCLVGGTTLGVIALIAVFKTPLWLDSSIPLNVGWASAGLSFAVIMELTALASWEHKSTWKNLFCVIPRAIIAFGGCAVMYLAIRALLA